jgi:hypothetical protein
VLLDLLQYYKKNKNKDINAISKAYQNNYNQLKNTVGSKNSTFTNIVTEFSKKPSKALSNSSSRLKERRPSKYQIRRLSKLKSADERREYRDKILQIPHTIPQSNIEENI